MSFYQLFVTWYTLVRRDVTRIIRIWPQTLLPQAITSTLYFLIFGSVIGSRIGPMKGISYIEFIAPGLIILNVITSSYANTTSSFFSMKLQRSIEEVLVSPTPNWIIVAGFVAGGMVRGLLVGLIVSIIAAFFVSFHVYSYVDVIAISLLTAALFSLIGMINGMFARKFDDIAIIPTFVLTPLTYLGGVFYSIAMLPPFWREISKVNPIFYIVDGFRYGFFKIHEVDFFYAVIIMAVLLILGFALAIRLLNRGKAMISGV